MGNYFTSTVEDQNKERADLIEGINKVGSELSHTYATKYLDPDFCNQVTMISTDNLVQYQKHVVNNKSYAFGYIGDVPETKDAICDTIKMEYEHKQALVTLILNCFKECSARIDSLAKGPICRTNPDVLERSKCPPGEWREHVVPPDAAVAENQPWFDLLNEFHKTFMKNLSVLKKILDDLQSHDAYNSLEEVKAMTQTVNKVTETVASDCGRLQRHILTIPTFTSDAIARRSKNQADRAQMARARRAALASGSH
jgi:hypothetical protein